MKRFLSYKRLIILAGVVMLVVVAALFVSRKTIPVKEAPRLSAPSKKDSIGIFIPTEGGYLMEKDIEVKESTSGQAKADLIMKELKAGNGLPENVVLRGLGVSADGVLYLNLSQEIRQEKMDAADEITTVYGIVNSFAANFKDVKGVQILVEGQAVQTLHGVMFMYAPIEFNNQLLEE